MRNPIEKRLYLGPRSVKRLSSLLLSTVLVLGATSASAQTSGWDGTGFLNVNIGVQAGETEFTHELRTPLYDETAVYRSSHTSRGGGLFDITGGVRLVGGLAAAFSFTRTNQDGEARVTGEVPHPLFFNRPREVQFTESDLSRRELGYHINAYYLFPMSEAFSIAVFGGPSFITLRQDLVSDVDIPPENEMPPFAMVNVGDVTLATESSSGVGANVGADLSYKFTETVGAGFSLRFVTGSVEIGEGPTAQSVDVGGVQLGGGLRLFF